MFKKFLIFVVVSLGFFVSFSFANLKVSPLKYQMEVERGETVKETVKISNNNEEAVTLYTSKEDFIAGGETGQPEFVEPEKNTSGFGLSKWISTNQNNITLAPGETREVRFSVSVPENGEPGGHYGALFFSPGGGDGQVSAVTRLGVLILVNVPGEAKINGNLESFELGADSDKDVYEKLPVNFSIRFKNNGNVHIQPQGKIVILDENGNQLEEVGSESKTTDAGVYLGEELVDYIPVNSEKGNVLPSQTRNFESSWKGFGYQILREDGTRDVKFKSLQEHMNEKASENKQYLKFWQDTKKVSVEKDYVAQMELSYEGKDGEKETFNRQKEFTVTYKKPKVVTNWYIVGGGGLVVIAVLYYLVVGRKRQQERLRQQLMQEMNKKNEESEESEENENIEDTEDIEEKYEEDTEDENSSDEEKEYDEEDRKNDNRG